MVRVGSRTGFMLKNKHLLMGVGLAILLVIGISANYKNTVTDDVLTAQRLKGLQDVSKFNVEGANNVVRKPDGTNDLIAPKESSVVEEKTAVIDGVPEKKALKDWRKQIVGECKAATTVDGMEMAAKKSSELYTLPSPESVMKLPRTPEKTLKPCRRIMMDFGANIGDTSGHLVDSGLVGCENKNIDPKSKFFHHFNVEHKRFETVGRRNPLTYHIIKLMGTDLGPEDYCYYGIEGNPVFTKRLQDIEDFVMSMKPRPIQHMHFLTESVGAGADGPTKLYLDTVNTKQNFWGSSIFEGHQDVRKSAEQEGKGEVVAADVMGYTIGSLMRKTLAFYSPDASEADKVNNHLILKVDIEGGEYPLLHQAAEEGTLCEFVKAGNKADLFIEFHSQKVTGRHDLFWKMKGNREKLEGCGVKFRNLAAFWA